MVHAMENPGRAGQCLAVMQQQCGSKLSSSLDFNTMFSWLRSAKQRVERTISKDSKKSALGDAHSVSDDKHNSLRLSDIPCSVYQERRRKLIQLIQKKYPNKKGAFVIFGEFEGQDAKDLEQEKSLVYFTGLHQEAVVLWVDMSGRSIVYTPRFSEFHNIFCSVEKLMPEHAGKIGVDEIAFLGDKSMYAGAFPIYKPGEGDALCNDLKRIIDQGDNIFWLAPPSSCINYCMPHCILQRFMIAQALGFNTETGIDPHFVKRIESCIDVSDIVSRMRSHKDAHELKLLERAIAYSVEAHKLVAQHCIAPGKTEQEIEASFDLIFKVWGLKHGYQPVITSGENALTLHRHSSVHEIKEGSLILIDVAVQYEDYKADITRTYPVSGKFTPRQKELYNLVLAAHDYIARIAKPGYSLNGKGAEKSLLELTKDFFDVHGGYGKYFPHGLGHFLGLEAHDAGLPAEPLEAGQVITIEPGLYIPGENIGIRIEDDYLVTKDGVRCLTDDMPRTAEEIEALMARNCSESR